MLVVDMGRFKQGVGYSTREIFLISVTTLLVLLTTAYIYSFRGTTADEKSVTTNDLQVLDDQVKAIYQGISAGTNPDQLVSLLGSAPNPRLLESHNSATELVLALHCNSSLPVEFLHRAPIMQFDGRITSDVSVIKDGKLLRNIQLVWYLVEDYWQLDTIFCSN